MQRRRFLHSAGTGVAALIAGCAGGGPRATPPQRSPTTAPTGEAVSLLALSAAYDAQKAFVDLLRAAGVPDDVTVTLAEPSYETVDQLAQLLQWLESGQPDPTLVCVRSEHLQHLAGVGALEPLEASLPDVPSGLLDWPFEPVVNAATHDEETYGVPLFGDVAGLFYRRDLLEEAGYHPDFFGEPLSWERFAAVVADVRDTTGTDGGYDVQLKANMGLSCCSVREVLTSLGGGYFGAPSDHAFGPVGDRLVTVDNGRTRQALRVLRGFLHGSEAEATVDVPSVVPDAALEWTEEPSRETFAAGDLVALRNWPYVIDKQGREASFGTDPGLAPLPIGVPETEASYPRTGGSRSSVNSFHVLVNQHAPAPRRREAATVLEAIATPTFRRGLFTIAGYLPPIRADLRSEEVADSVYGRFTATLAAMFERGLNVPATNVWERQAAELAITFHDVLAGDAHLDALADLETTVKQLERTAAAA